MKHLLLLLAVVVSFDVAIGQSWTSLNSPAGFKNVRDLTMNDGGNKWYAADEVKLLKSSDTAKTWAATSSVINGPIAVACKDDNPDVVFVSGSTFFKKSTNGGSSWTDISVTNKPTAMINFPQNENCFLFGRKYLSSSEKAIFRTTDGGATWSQELSTSHQTTIFDLNVNPNTGWPGYAVAAGAPTGAQTDKGVYESPNYGATWYAKNTTTGIGFTACAIIKWDSHVDSSWVYAGTADGKLYRERYNNTLTQLGSFTGMTTDTIRAIRINKSRYTTVYVLTDRSIYRTINNGSTWSIVSSGMVDSRGLSLDFHPSDTTQLIVGSKGHIYRSTNTASSWAIVGGTTTRTLPVGSISKAGSKFFGASDVLTMEMHYDGSAWDTSRLGRNDSVFLAKHSLSISGASGFRYAFHAGVSDNTSRAHWTTDGSTFTDVPAFHTDTAATSCEGMVQDPSLASRVYAFGLLKDGSNTRNYFESLDSGATWTKPSEAGITQNNPWYALLPLGDGSGSASQLLLSGVKAGSGNGGIWRSQNEGTNWVRVSGGSTGDVSIKSIANNPKAPAYAYAGGQGGLWYSSNANHATDGSVSFANNWWTADVKKIVIDPRFTASAHNSAYVFWIASNNTIYRSESNGGSATAVNGDLPAGVVLNDLRTDPADSTLLYLATDQGVYKAQLIRAPSLISPTNNATNLLYCISTTEPLVFSWWGVSGATSYDIQIDDDPAFGSKLRDASTSLTTYSLTSDMVCNTVYYWRVRASDGTSFGKSPFRTFQFTTSGCNPDTLPAPTLSSPDSGATGIPLNVSLSWVAVTGAVKYKVNVSGRPAIYTSNTSYAPGLAEGTMYQWNVTAINCNANVDISPTWSFRTCTNCNQQGPEGPQTIHQEVEAENVVTQYALLQNYPNPFNPRTRFDYALLGDGPVQLRIYNTLGEEVAILVDGYQSRGWKTVEYDAGHLPSGIYFYRLDAGRFVSIKKMVLIK